LVYAILAILFFVFAWRIIARGPEPPHGGSAGGYANPGKE
jgi:hypothetical protein